MEKTKHKILCLGICSSLLASALHGVVDFPLHKPSSALQFWVLAGLLIGFATTLQKNKNVFNAKQKKSALVGFAVIVAITTPLSANLYYSHIPGNIHHQNAILATDTDCTTAVDEIETSLEHSPYFFRTHNSRIDIYFKCIKDNEIIFPVLNQELAIDDTNVKALIKRGYIHLEKGHFPAAYKDFSKIKQLLPHRVYGQYGIAQTLISSGNIQQGLIELNIIIKDHPEFDDAKKQLHDVEEFIKRSRTRIK